MEQISKCNGGHFKICEHLVIEACNCWSTLFQYYCPIVLLVVMVVDWVSGTAGFYVHVVHLFTTNTMMHEYM